MALLIVEEIVEKFFGITKVDRVNSYLTYDGRCYDRTSLTSDACWQIKRTIINGDVTTTEYVDDGKFNQVWDNRASLFTGGTYFNQLSTFFDGVNDYIDFGNNFSFETSIAFSVSLWIKPQNFSSQRYIFSKMSAGTGVPGYRIGIDTSGKIISQVRSASSALASVTFNTTLTADVWTHVVWVWTGSSNQSGQRVYINGALDSFIPASSALVGSWIHTETFKLGAALGTGFFVGKIDEFSIYNKAINQAEVTEIFNSSSPTDLETLTTVGNLVSWHKMGDGDTYPVVLDQVGSVNGTLTNMSASNFVSDVP
jgi:hypothetical protein